MREIGFLLLTHSNPSQIERLIDRLNVLYDFPPIVCHHDFSKCALAAERLSKNVALVQPHFITAWADFSVVEATVCGFRLLFDRADAPKWAVVLSGADYPIKPAETVVTDLNKGGFDAHILAMHVDRSTRKEHPWVNKCFHRYCTTRVDYPSLDRKFRSRQRTLRLRIPFYTARTLPFSPSLRCHAGRQWFSINRRAGEVIARNHRERPELAVHFRKVAFSEESYFQTILANDPTLRLSQQDWRYVEFPAGMASPKILTMADLPLLDSSPAHFARKFDPIKDSQVLDELDRRVGGAPQKPSLDSSIEK